MRERISELIKKHGITGFIYTYLPQTRKASMVTSKTRFGQAMHLEKKGKIEEAIELFKQAADFYPAFAFKYLRIAAELAEKRSMYKEAYLLWLESMYYTPNLHLKLVSLKNSIRDFILDKLIEDLSYKICFK